MRLIMDVYDKYQFDNDKDFMDNIMFVSTDDLFEELEYFGCDGYYRQLWGCVVEELKKRVVR